MSQMAESSRILPGGYIYSSDLLSTPHILKNVGRIIANAFKDEKSMLSRQLQQKVFH